MEKLYLRYLRAESFRKALIYQKKYLLLLIGGFQDSEQETLSMIAHLGFPSKADKKATESRPSPGLHGCQGGDRRPKVLPVCWCEVLRSFKLYSCFLV